ncbi:hypothetical protein [Empedobacter falsenii]
METYINILAFIVCVVLLIPFYTSFRISQLLVSCFGESLKTGLDKLPSNYTKINLRNSAILALLHLIITCFFIYQIILEKNIYITTLFVLDLIVFQFFFFKLIEDSLPIRINEYFKGFKLLKLFKHNFYLLKFDSNEILNNPINSKEQLINDGIINKPICEVNGVIMNELKIMNKSNKKYFRKTIDKLFFKMQIDLFQNINKFNSLFTDSFCFIKIMSPEKFEELLNNNNYSVTLSEVNYNLLKDLICFQKKNSTKIDLIIPYKSKSTKRKISKSELIPFLNLFFFIDEISNNDFKTKYGLSKTSYFNKYFLVNGEEDKFNRVDFNNRYNKN